MKKTMYFEEWAKIWLSMVKGTVRDNTFAATYENSVNNHLIPYFYHKKLEEIKQIDIQLYLNNKAAIFCLDTVKKDKSCLKQMYEAALNNGLCKCNPVTNIKMPQCLPSVEKQIYTQQQIDYIFQYGNSHRFGYEVQLLIETGISRAELLGLQWQDIDFVNAVMYINRDVTDTKSSETGKIHISIALPKNRFRKRAIPLSSRILNILLTLFRKRKDKLENYIVKCKSGSACSPRNWSRRHYDVFMQDMQHYFAERETYIPIYTPHQFRHTRASIWVNDGKNLYAVAKVLGHADLDMLRKRYVHSDVEQLRQLLKIK